MVLAGGPDRERPVSLLSGANIAEALSQTGHDMRLCDILPDDLSALDQFEQWPGDVVFPILHGPWGEGGGLQRILDQRRLAYVGSRAAAAELCMDKYVAKMALQAHRLSTPRFERVSRSQRWSLPAPLVVKALREGSSIDLEICRDEAQVRTAAAKLFARHEQLLFEQFITGMELTVSVLGSGAASTALPPIQIVPATAYYDYEAKYTRNDTQYLFDIPLPQKTLSLTRDLAVAAHRATGCRHLSRVDFIVDQRLQPWILEINTLPGFTSHSLLPKAAARAGMTMPQLTDRLVRMALAASDHPAPCRCP